MNRETFEKWLLDKMGLQAEWQPERNCYKQFTAHLAWKAWQAACQEGRVMPNAVLIVLEQARREGWYEDNKKWEPIDKWLA